ncbi:MAG TPA: M48 family metallopeptidase [Rhizomicrobium sp.]|nr:M48 family metallopeptidase [Rhizomicrobium sp.]
MRKAIGAAMAALAMIFAFLALTAMAAPAPAPTSTVQVQSLPPPASTAPATKPFSAERATNAYLATVKGEARERSDAYFEGGYWLLLVDTAYAVLVAALLLWLRISARMRDTAQRITRSRFWQVPIYVIQFLILTAILTLPLTVYEGFFREHAYGLSNMSFGQWFGDFGKGFALELVGLTILLTLIYAAVRAAGRSWWVWGWLISVAFSVFVLVIAPVFIAPVFNKYYPLKAGPVKSEILSLARSDGIPATDVYEFNASRQSKRISANVSGFLGTTRISMTDNLINRATPREIYAVLGHEMGHYVLSHNVIGLTWIGLVLLVAFLFVNWGFYFLTGFFGGNWNVRAIDDPAGLPVAMALISIFFFFATPVTNAITRTLEAQADIFGLNTARQPDGFATVTLKLSEYRKLDPSPLEEAIFYDHPSGRSRIGMAMRWKVEHLNDPDIKAGPMSPQ